MSNIPLWKVFESEFDTAKYDEIKIGLLHQGPTVAKAMPGNPTDNTSMNARTWERMFEFYYRLSNGNEFGQEIRDTAQSVLIRTFLPGSLPIGQTTQMINFLADHQPTHMMRPPCTRYIAEWLWGFTRYPENVMNLPRSVRAALRWGLGHALYSQTAILDVELTAYFKDREDQRTCYLKWDEWEPRPLRSSPKAYNPKDFGELTEEEIMRRASLCWLRAHHLVNSPE